MPVINPRPGPSPGIVGIFAWLVPGGGYFLLGKRTRGAVVSVTIISLFLMGILIGGIRIMDPPGWGQYGYMTQIVSRDRADTRRVIPTSAAEEADPTVHDGRDKALGSALLNEPLAELGSKPWFVGQILCGPLTLGAAALSVHEARPNAPAVDADSAREGAAPLPGAGNGSTQEGVPSSHSRGFVHGGGGHAQSSDHHRCHLPGRADGEGLMLAAEGYVPFINALPIWAAPWIWPLLLLPLCAAVAIVYKSVRCSQMSRVPREASILFITILLGMIFTAAALAGLAHILQ
jgi:hypothetical protein